MKSDMMITMKYLDYIRLEDTKSKYEKLIKDISDCFIPVNDEGRVVFRKELFFGIAKQYLDSNVRNFFVELD